MSACRAHAITSSAILVDPTRFGMKCLISRFNRWLQQMIDRVGSTAWHGIHTDTLTHRTHTHTHTWTHTYTKRRIMLPLPLARSEPGTVFMIFPWRLTFLPSPPPPPPLACPSSFYTRPPSTPLLHWLREMHEIHEIQATKWYIAKLEFKSDSSIGFHE